MSQAFLKSLSLIILWLFSQSVIAAEDDPRFLAKLENGEFVEDQQLRNWYSDNALPQLAGRSLLDGNNPMRWLLDRSLQIPEIPEAYLEMHNGDRLPGEVISAAAANSKVLLQEPAYFEVSAAEMLTRGSRLEESNRVRVIQSHVRKIVWQGETHRVDQYFPNTLFYKDGRRITFRSIRFQEVVAHLLLESGRRSVPLDEIAAVHFAEKDPWDSYVQELCVLFPQGFYVSQGLPRLLQIVTTKGLIATTSLNRFSADSRKDNNDSDRWLHGIQPAWSLDALWTSSRSTWLRRSWSVDRVPVSRLPYTEDRTGAMFSNAAWHARNNRSVQGRLLKSGDQQFAWGIGVIAPSRLSFSIPRFAEGFSTTVGLDSLARNGGSIQARIKSNLDNGKLLYESPVTIGTQQLHKSPDIRFAADKVPEQILLEVDPLFENSPAGADPFDIRDMTNWLEPVIVLNRELLEKAVTEQTPKSILAFANWQWIIEENKQPEFYCTFRDIDFEQNTWRTTILAKEAPFSIMRKVQLGSNAKWLVLATGKFGNFGKEPKIEVFVDGHLMKTTSLPSTGSHDLGQTPRYVPLHGFSGREVEIVIRQHPSNPRAPIDWRSIEILDQRTTLFAALEDPTRQEVEQLQSKLDNKNQLQLYDHVDHVSSPAVEVKQGDWVQIAQFDQPVPIRERPELGEFRDFRFAFKKLGRGSVEIKLHHPNEFDQPVIYRFGEDDKSEDREPFSLERMGNLEEKWLVRNRNLYSDFKSLDVTGISVRVPDGTKCLFDHIYFARSYSDLQLIEKMTPDKNNWLNWESHWEELVPEVSNAIAHITSESGQKSLGVVIHPNEPLIALPAIIAKEPGKILQIKLSDGTQTTATTLGVLREANLALAEFKIESKNERRPHLDITYRENWDPQEAFLLVGSSTAKPTEMKFEMVQTLGELESRHHWAASTKFSFQASSILIDRDKKLTGILSHRLSGGQPVFTNWSKLRSGADRLKTSTMIGQWLPGTQPQIPWQLVTSPEGIKIESLLPSATTAYQVFNAGDILQRIGGIPIKTRYDVPLALKPLKYGDEVEIEFLRGDRTLTQKIPLNE